MSVENEESEESTMIDIGEGVDSSKEEEAHLLNVAQGLVHNRAG